MTLTEALEFLVDYVVNDEFAKDEIADDLWHSPGFLKDWEPVMVNAINHRKLSQVYWDEVCHEALLSNFVLSFAKLWDSLTKAGVVYPLKEIQGHDASIVTIWAYVEYWEPTTSELWSTDYFQMRPLLEAAADPSCPKRNDCIEGIGQIFQYLASRYPTGQHSDQQEQRYAKGRHEHSSLPSGIQSIERVGAYWLIALSQSSQIFQVHSDGGVIRTGVRINDKILFA